MEEQNKYKTEGLENFYKQKNIKRLEEILLIKLMKQSVKYMEVKKHQCVTFRRTQKDRYITKGLRRSRNIRTFPQT